MPIDRTGAEQFIWSTARLVDRHRYAMLFGDGSAGAVVEALRGYRNVRRRLRARGSSPTCAVRAASPRRRCTRSRSSTRRAPATYWHAAHALGSRRSPRRTVASRRPAGIRGLPARAVVAPGPGSVLTFGLAAVLHAGGAPGDGWLTRATDWCWREIATNQQPGGYWLKYVCAFLDAVPDDDRARQAIASLARRVDPSASAIAGFVEGEALRPLDLSPRPVNRSRALVQKPRSRRTSMPSSPNSDRTAVGTSTGWRGRPRRQTTGVATSRSAP